MYTEAAIRKPVQCPYLVQRLSMTYENCELRTSLSFTDEPRREYQGLPSRSVIP